MSASSAYVLDASILVTRVRPSEAAHEDVRALLLALTAARVPLSVPVIVLAEVGAALALPPGNWRNCLDYRWWLWITPWASLLWRSPSANASATVMLSMSRWRKDWTLDSSPWIGSNGNAYPMGLLRLPQPLS